MAFFFSRYCGFLKGLLTFIEWVWVLGRWFVDHVCYSYPLVYLSFSVYYLLLGKGSANIYFKLITSCTFCTKSVGVIFGLLLRKFRIWVYSYRLDQYPSSPPPFSQLNKTSHPPSPTSLPLILPPSIFIPHLHSPSHHTQDPQKKHEPSRPMISRCIYFPQRYIYICAYRYRCYHSSSYGKCSTVVIPRA